MSQVGSRCCFAEVVDVATFNITSTIIKSSSVFSLMYQLTGGFIISVINGFFFVINSSLSTTIGITSKY